MKHSIKLLLLMLAYSAAAHGQQQAHAEIEFLQTTHSFDTISPRDGDYACTFRFANTGNAPLIVSDVVTSCGCTATEWSAKPVMPGGEGSVEVRYKATNQGSFVKTILVKSNAKEAPKVALQIKGYVAEAKHGKEKAGKAAKREKAK